MNFLLIESFFTNSLFLLFFLNVLIYWISFVFIKENSLKKLPLKQFSKITSNLSLILLFIYLSCRWIVGHYFPISNLYESILFLICILSFLLVFGEYKANSQILGSIISPIILLLFGFAILKLPLSMQKISPLVPSLQSNWLMMHVSMMMISYAVLLAGTLFSILYLVLKNIISLRIFFLKQKLTIKNLDIIKVKQIEKYYLINNLDFWSYRLITLGFPILTIGIISGAVWANEAWGSYWSWDPKETWALITWLNFSAYLHQRLKAKSKKEDSVKIASLGFFTIWICYLGVNFLGQGLHSYGWLS